MTKKRAEDMFNEDTHNIRELEKIVEVRTQTHKDKHDMCHLACQMPTVQ